MFLTEGGNLCKLSLPILQRQHDGLMIFGLIHFNSVEFGHILKVHLHQVGELAAKFFKMGVGSVDSGIEHVDYLLLPVISHDNDLEGIGLWLFDNFLIGVINNLENLVIIDDPLVVSAELDDGPVDYFLKHIIELIP